MFFFFLLNYNFICATKYENYVFSKNKIFGVLLLFILTKGIYLRLTFVNILYFNSIFT